MKRQLCIKRLTHSDLTFFYSYYSTQKERGYKESKQKAINLNANIFISQLFPALPEYAKEKDGVFGIRLRVFGPAGQQEYPLQRKISKATPSYKNWRLNGEYINDPEGENGRFNLITQDDIAILEFHGRHYPESLSLCLLSKNSPIDQPFYNLLDKWLSTTKMQALTHTELNSILQPIASNIEHPILRFADEEFFENIAMDAEWCPPNQNWTSRGTLTQGELQGLKQDMSEIGRDGEQLVYHFLHKQSDDKEITSFEWEADRNAIAPYDFHIIDNNDQFCYIDVKSTRGTFENRIHISMNELRQMANSLEPYKIYRVFQLQDGQANLKISSDLTEFAKHLLSQLHLPEGISLSSFSIAPQALPFETEIYHISSVEISHSDDN